MRPRTPLRTRGPLFENSNLHNKLRSSTPLSLALISVNQWLKTLCDTAPRRETAHFPAFSRRPRGSWQPRVARVLHFQRANAAFYGTVTRQMRHSFFALASKNVSPAKSAEKTKAFPARCWPRTNNV
jgi:hypothetical protein